MKILLVTPAYRSFPVGISYVSACLKKAGHQVLGHVFQSREGLEKVLSSSSFGAAGFGGMTFQFSALSEIASTLRNAHIPVFGGGGIFTSEPELMTRELGVDYAVLGEGEQTVVQLIEHLESGKNPESVPGLGWVKSGTFFHSPSSKTVDSLDDVPFPDYAAFGFNKHLDRMQPTDQWYDVSDHPRVYPLITSRSCPYLCTFCYHPLGTKYRQRSIDSIIHEIDFALSFYRVNLFDFYDELFAQDVKRVREFCRRFRETVARYSWEVRWSCSLRVSDVKDEILDLLRQAGCFMINYGFESYSWVVLKSMKKYITPAQIDAAVTKTQEKNISIQANFIFGDPAETLETARETLEYWKRHRSAWILLAFIVPCPDSEVYRHCLKTGLIPDRLTFIRQGLFEPVNMTSLSESEFHELQALISRYTHAYATYVTPVMNSRGILRIRCPFCRSMLEFKNYFTRPLFFCHLMHCRVCRKRFHNASGLYIMFARTLAFFITPWTYRLLKGLKKLVGFLSPHALFREIGK